MAILTLAHSYLRAESLRVFDHSQEILKLWPGQMSVFFDNVAHLVKEEVNFLLNQLQVRIGGPPVLHLGGQLTDLVLLLLREALVLVALLDKALYDGDILANLAVERLLVPHQIEDASLVVFGLARQDLLLAQLLILDDCELVHGFPQLDGLDLKFFLLQVHLAHLVVQLLNLIVF